jgi:two-component system, response regulator PdtaR
VTTAKRKILIVEDEALIALDLKTALKRRGHELCEVAASGETAVARAERESPDVVIMDINLSGVMDGIEAASRIRSFSSPMIIFTTGYSDPELHTRAMRLEPAAFLHKPVQAKDIEAML